MSKPDPDEIAKKLKASASEFTDLLNEAEELGLIIGCEIECIRFVPNTKGITEKFWDVKLLISKEILK